MLTELLGRSISCECGRTHTVATRFATVSRSAIGELGSLTRASGLRSSLLLVADPQTWEAAGAAAETSLRSAGFQTRQLILDPHPVAGPEAVTRVGAARSPEEDLVAIGAGTVNDIVKSAAHAAGRPYVVAGTALSMNGYTSAISALLDGGVKRTVPATPPVAVVIDLDICARAPLSMTRAGLGDMLSKPFSEADWRLSSAVEGGYYCGRPGSILTDAFERMRSEAAGIGVAAPDSLAPLAEAVLLSGIAMAMAGTSSPASGGEHLISHYWDMQRYATGEHPWALHGTQVGVACCLIEPLHRRVFLSRPDDIDIDRALADWPADRAAAEAAVRVRHRELPGGVVDGIVAEALAKWRPPGEQRERLTRLIERLPRIGARCAAALLPEGAVRRALEASGSAIDPADVSSSLSGDIYSWGHVRDIRARYTVLDLAAELGRLRPQGRT